LKNKIKVCLVDYGIGNIKAFKNIYEKLNVHVEIASKQSQFDDVTHLILPGVGAFDWAISKLNDSGLREILDTFVLEKRIPILGVCVGMQIMASQSEEGVMPGLNWIKGKVLKLDKNIVLPHMGWNRAEPLLRSDLFKNIEDPEFYFLHSYYYETEDEKHVLAVSEYGKFFTSAICDKNIFGTQFHPEKSHKNGIKILENFLKIAC
jgi:glutamine amidotransferase